MNSETATQRKYESWPLNGNQNRFRLKLVVLSWWWQLEIRAVIWTYFQCPTMTCLSFRAKWRQRRKCSAMRRYHKTGTHADCPNRWPSLDTISHKQNKWCMSHRWWCPNRSLGTSEGIFRHSLQMEWSTGRECYWKRTAESKPPESSRNFRSDTRSKRPIHTYMRPSRQLNKWWVCSDPICPTTSQQCRRQPLVWSQCKRRTEMDPSSHRPMWRISLRKQQPRKSQTVAGMRKIQSLCLWVDRLRVSSIAQTYCLSTHAVIHFAISKYRFLHEVLDSWNFLLARKIVWVHFPALFFS